MAGFAELLAAAAPLADGFALAIPEDWHQGRTAYGGLSAALALEAAVRVGEVRPPLRSAQISFVGPLYGAVEVRARVLRRGKNAIWVAAEITRDGEVGLVAAFVFMGPVESALRLDERPAPEERISPEDARPFATTHSPIFLQKHFEARFALPRKPEKRPDVAMWVRLLDREGIAPMTELLLAADALPPGVQPLLPPRGVPVSSMTWQANLLTPAPATRDGWWLMRSTGDYAEQGCSGDRQAIWNAAGEPVLAGMQSVALFG